MAIGNAVERGGWVFIYDENNKPNDGLKGYTSSRVNVQRGGWIYSYDQNGHQVGAVSAGR